MVGEVTPLELCGIGKRFGRLSVLRGVDLRVDAGEVVGLIGANGSGKTTLLGIAVGLLPPTEGHRRLGGHDAPSVRLEQRQRIAFVTHTTQLYPRLTARENMRLFAELRRAAGAESEPAEPLLRRLGLHDAADRLVGTFSRGMQQRLALARALMGRPELLLLDEPFTALDRPGRQRLAEVLLEERDRGLAVLLSSHDYDAVVSVTSRVVLLEGGRLCGQVRREDAQDALDYRDQVSRLGLLQAAGGEEAAHA
ncbi:MAG: heme ABC exporter ATP-binding protein CcmA [Myxococcales bacterium]|nr:heme ABC exporter ATP-binding protein CcmA [Myxococcales bacterium]